eukprot:Skav210499  [mRNA]  locus=scaffold601:319166:323710:- [translate_table: standard]
MSVFSKPHSVIRANIFGSCSYPCIISSIEIDPDPSTSMRSQSSASSIMVLSRSLLFCLAFSATSSCLAWLAFSTITARIKFMTPNEMVIMIENKMMAVQGSVSKRGKQISPQPSPATICENNVMAAL